MPSRVARADAPDRRTLLSVGYAVRTFFSLSTNVRRRDRVGIAFVKHMRQLGSFGKIWFFWCHSVALEERWAVPTLPLCGTRRMVGIAMVCVSAS